MQARLSIVAVFGIVVCSGLLASGSDAATIRYVTSLSSEVLGSSGTGSAKVVYDDDLHWLSVSVEFSGLTGTTTVAHIHCCVDAPGTVGVATYPGTFPGFPAGVTSGSYTSPWLDLTDPTVYASGFLAANGGTAAGAEAGLLAGLAAGRAYLNIHTSFAPGGEIRGFLAPPVPEPGAALLFGVGTLLVAGRTRRRSACAT